MTAFGRRLRLAVQARGQLCVGIDPHEGLLRGWGLDATAAGAREFGLRVVEAAAGRVAVVKPQVAFFERYGSAGFAALEDVLVAARAADLIVIADAKRGDIGSSNEGYAAAWLTAGSPLEADALTVSPYLGVGSLSGVIDVALAHDKGLFVLAATSNPEAEGLQRAIVAGGVADGSDAGSRTVAHEVVREVSARTAPRTPEGEWASIGFVIGATVDRAAAGLPDALSPAAPILAPGFGAQGAAMCDLAGIFDELAPSVLASASRSILRAGPDGIVAAIDAHNRELKASTHA